MTSHPISITPHPEKGFILTAELIVERPLEEVFDFFSSAENLEAITPPWLHFQIVTPTPLNIKEKSLIDYKLKLHGIPIRWRTEIAAWEPPYRFVDQQLRGPYKRWYHEHTFESLGPNRTLAKDRVHYIPRFGSLVHKFFVKPDLLKIFGYRQEQLAKIFANDPSKTVANKIADTQTETYSTVQ
jgi:ligand-binding SRPBCC domain-containing protein